MVSQKKVEKQILQQLQGNSKWNFIVPPNNWLCPYCGELGAENLSQKDKIEKKIYLHFIEGCTSWHFFEGEELEEEILQQRSLLLKLKGKIPQELSSNQSWHLKDKQGFWFCPFCLKKTTLLYGNLKNSPGAFFEHLSQCSLFVSRRGASHSITETKEALDRHHKNLQLHFLKEKILSQPEWQALDSLSLWHCPYCLAQTEVALARGKLAREQLEKIFNHLSICSDYNRGKGKPHPLDKIREALVLSNQKNRFQKLYNSITSDTLWQLLTDQGHWFCPYCANSSEVLVKDYNWKECLPKVADHLSECQDRKFSKDPRPFKEVKEKLKEYNKKEKILQVLKEEWRNPLFRCTLKGGGWVCPYCRTAWPHIVLGGGDLGLSDVVEHLSSHCPAYFIGELPQSTIEDLKKTFQKPAPAPKAREAHSTLTKRRIRSQEKLKLFKEEQKMLVQSLEDAREKQLRMLPQTPQVKGLEFQCLYRPSKHIGGDFYDIVPLTNKKWGLSIGDVAGHGIEAALLVGMVKKLLEIHGKNSSSPLEVLSRTHQDLLGDLDDKTFITVFYAILDLENKTLNMANGGHLPLLLYNSKREVPLQKVHLEGMPLGVKDGNAFFQSLQEEEMELMAGDTIFLYTDGLLEARRGDLDFFGEKKLLELVKKYGKYELEYLIYKIDKEVSRFQGPKQEDDLTILSFFLQ